MFLHDQFPDTACHVRNCSGVAGLFETREETPVQVRLCWFHAMEQQHVLHVVLPPPTPPLMRPVTQTPTEVQGYPYPYHYRSCRLASLGPSKHESEIFHWCSPHARDAWGFRVLLLLDIDPTPVRVIHKQGEQDYIYQLELTHETRCMMCERLGLA